MKKEYKLVLELCKFINPDREKIISLLRQDPDMSAVLGHILYNRAGLFAYCTLEKCDLLFRVSHEFRETLKSAYESECVKPSSLNFINDELQSDLNNPDYIIHLCTRMYKKAVTLSWMITGRDLSLREFFNIYVLVNKWLNDDLYKELKYRVYEFKLHKECYYVFLHAKELFDIKNKFLDKLIIAIKPSQTTYLKEIVNPVENKKYRYNEPFTEWFFDNGRKKKLCKTSSNST